MSDFPFLVPPNDKENMSSPIPCLKTPIENKVPHPIIKNLIVKRSNSMINESFFTEADVTPSQLNFLSPDLVGGLFPKEINTNQVNMERIEILCKTFRGYCHNDSSNITSNDSILPSPCINDSGFTSLKSEMLTMSRSLSVPVTPPSSFKWNRKEYRSNRLEESILTDEESNDEYIPERNHLESTQIFDNETCLADNASMRRFSSIGLKTNTCSNHASSTVNKSAFKGKPLKSFVDSKINNSSGFFSLGESSLSINNTNSNEINNKNYSEINNRYYNEINNKNSNEINNRYSNEINNKNSNEINNRNYNEINNRYFNEINNINSNEIYKTNRTTPYYRSSPRKESNKKIHFNLNINSPIIKPLLEINQDISMDNKSNFSQSNNSNDFSNSFIEIDSPVFDNHTDSNKCFYTRFDLNGSAVNPKFIDLDISPIHSDADID